MPQYLALTDPVRAAVRKFEYAPVAAMTSAPQALLDLYHVRLDRKATERLLYDLMLEFGIEVQIPRWRVNRGSGDGRCFANVKNGTVSFTAAPKKLPAGVPASRERRLEGSTTNAEFVLHEFAHLVEWSKNGPARRVQIRNGWGWRRERREWHGPAFVGILDRLVAWWQNRAVATRQQMICCGE